MRGVLGSVSETLMFEDWVRVRVRIRIRVWHRVRISVIIITTPNVNVNPNPNPNLLMFEEWGASGTGRKEWVSSSAIRLC
jgi:hypothetical protein